MLRIASLAGHSDEAKLMEGNLDSMQTETGFARTSSLRGVIGERDVDTSPSRHPYRAHRSNASVQFGSAQESHNSRARIADEASVPC
jgi:hypothetical protein